MRFSVRSLKRYLDTDLPARRIADALTQSGLEVEEIIDLGMISGKLVTGEILAIDAIEGADKIRLVTVQADEKEPLKIVCGAWNIEPGQKVPVARFGMVFPGGFELKPRKIKGIEGQGMLCSPSEIGISEDSDGIWILDNDTPVGEPYDALIEINITPNRPDVLSLIGVARDLCAKIAQTDGARKPTLRLPDLSLAEGKSRTEQSARVTVQAREDCPRYTARVVKGVRVGPSPRWMQVALESAGLRPINNIVDITNYVLLEYGHPLHAFDLDRLAGKQIVVRNATPGETIETLDGEVHNLEPSDLLICDAQKPVALAGIMGGANSEITDSTVDVLIESAYFRPQTIRKTSKRLDKSTDSSYRFERGTDARKITAPLNRCAQLIAQIAGGEIQFGIIDEVGNLPEKDPILVRIGRLNRFLGTNLTGRQIAEVLLPLGFEIRRSDKEEMLVAVPTHRVDVSLEADIFEEVARIYGYDRIAERQMAIGSVHHALSPLDQLRDTLSEAALGLGLSQAVNFSFVSESANRAVGLGDARQVRLLNPIVVEQSVMRRSMLPSLLLNVAHNLNQSVEDIALYEVGHTYEFEKEEAEERDAREERPPAIERPFFAMALCGGGKRNWRDAAKEYDFFDLKGCAEYLLNAAGIGKQVIEPVADVAWLHPGRAARLLVKGQPIALFGEVHPALLKELDIRKPVQYLEILLEGAIFDAAARPAFRDIPRYPAVVRDIALVVDRSVRSLELERTIRRAGKDLLANVRLFDVYEGQHVEPGRKSLAFSLTYRAPDRTLKEDEVNARHAEVIAALEKENGATLRG